MERHTEVLVIEDDPLFRIVLEAAFSSEETMRVRFCSGMASTATEMARRHQPDVIVLDFLLHSGTSGVELAPMLREAAPRSRAVLYTGATDTLTRASQCPAIDAAVDKLALREVLPTVRRLASQTSRPPKAPPAKSSEVA